MSATAPNPFAPPRAAVDDHYDTQLELVEAGRGARFVAVLIDGLAPFVVIMGILAAVAIPAYQTYVQRAKGLPVAHDAGGAIIAVAALAGLAMLAFFIYSATLVYRYGQTVGKRMMGIRVVRSDGSRVAFSRFIFLRWLPLFIVGIIPWIGYLSGLVDALLIFRDSHQCLHDNIADTRVVTAASSESATLDGSSTRSLRSANF
ncbi:MAG: RDD family protein [Burkholderiaceae bacterium]|jgi:uncharacterized RDD family membrane protein YckC